MRLNPEALKSWSPGPSTLSLYLAPASPTQMHTVEITVLKSLVQCPPPGPFSIDSTVWAKGSRGTAAIYSAVIPSNRLKDFRPDLGAELDSNWTVFRTRPRKVSQQCIRRPG